MEGRDLLSILDLSAEEAKSVLALAEEVKTSPKEFSSSLSGKVMVMLFEKPSLRTRVTFESGIYSLGGTAIYLAPEQVQMGEREPVSDVAHNLDRWVQVIVARTYRHTTIEELARAATIPTINALSDREHPCQALADFQTVRQFFGSAKAAITFVGDGNNVCHSLMLLGAMLGYDIRVACPRGYEPCAEITQAAAGLAQSSGGSVYVGNDPRELAEGAEVLYTDVWTSMGQEGESKKRHSDFNGFQVDMALVRLASPEVKVMHCLPAHRDEEISSEVMDSPAAIFYDQAENRLHSQKALLLKLVGGL
jgi:ornithine carbamoyltransferase